MQYFIFQNMDASEREKFGKKASSSNGSNYREPTKYTSFGVTFDEIDRQKETERAKVQRMTMTIEEMLQTAEEQDGEFLCNSSLQRHLTISLFFSLEDAPFLLLQHHRVRPDAPQRYFPS